jgi:hypothetical protein
MGLLGSKFYGFLNYLNSVNSHINICGYNNFHSSFKGEESGVQRRKEIVPSHKTLKPKVWAFNYYPLTASLVQTTSQKWVSPWCYPSSLQHLWHLPHATPHFVMSPLLGCSKDSMYESILFTLTLWFQVWVKLSSSCWLLHRLGSCYLEPFRAS